MLKLRVLFTNGRLDNYLLTEVDEKVIKEEIRNNKIPFLKTDRGYIFLHMQEVSALEIIDTERIDI